MMWWGRSDNRNFNGLWIIIAIGIAVALFSGKAGGWFWWLLFPLCFFVLPMIFRSAACYFRGEKRKHDYEKPKRTMTSEDGEVFEVIEEAPVRKSKTDDIEYV